MYSVFSNDYKNPRQLDQMGHLAGNPHRKFNIPI